MIFSAEKWNNAKEIKQFMQLSTSISFEKMETPLSNAFRLFIAPMLGEEMVNILIDIYNSGRDGEAYDRKRDLQLLQLCQRANANLGMWYDFDEISTRITDSGFQRQESDSLKPVYKYQENNLRQNFKNKGFNALDEVLAFLEKNMDAYPEFAFADAHLYGIDAIVRTTDEVNRVYFINGSRIIFLRLQTHFKFVEENVLRPALSEKLYEQLLEWLRKLPDDETERLKIEELRIKAGKVVIMQAVKRLMTETGTLTDRGLYFTSIQANKNSDDTEQPVSDERLSLQVSQAESDAQAYMTQLMKYVRRAFSELYAGNSQRVYDRDNDNKSTFWA